MNNTIEIISFNINGAEIASTTKTSTIALGAVISGALGATS